MFLDKEGFFISGLMELLTERYQHVSEHDIYGLVVDTILFEENLRNRFIMAEYCDGKSYEFIAEELGVGMADVAKVVWSIKMKIIANINSFISTEVKEKCHREDHNEPKSLQFFTGPNIIRLRAGYYNRKPEEGGKK